jgi:hypothetical protein
MVKRREEPTKIKFCSGEKKVTVTPEGDVDAGHGAAVSSTHTQEKQCFCQLDSGLVEDCGCSASIIEEFNKDKMHSQVPRKVGSRYGTWMLSASGTLF